MIVKAVVARMRSGPVSKILAGSVVGQGLLIAVSPLLTRLYDARDFGLLAVFTALVSIFGVLVTLKWESAIVLPVDDADARAVAWLGLLTTAVMTGACAVVVGLNGQAIAASLGSPDLAPVLWILPITLFVSGFQRIGSSWFVRTQAYGKLGRRNLLQGIGQVLAQVIGGFADLRPLGLIIGLPAGRIAASGGFLGRSGVFGAAIPSIGRMTSMARRFKKFPTISSLSALVNSGGLQAPILVLSWGYGAVAIGALALAMRVLASPVGIICDAISQYFEGEVSRQMRSGFCDIRLIIARTMGKLVLIGAVPLLLILLIGPELFSFVFGAEWRPAGSYAQLMSIAYFAQYLVVPFSRTLILLERQGQQLLWDTVRASVTIGCVAVLAAVSAPLWVSVASLAVSQFGAYAFLFLMIWRSTKPHNGKYSRGFTNAERQKESLT